MIRSGERRRLSEEDGEGTGPGFFRGYAIYDANGDLVLRCPDQAEGTHSLLPGKYVAIGALEYGLVDYEEKQAQFVIEAGRSTTVDFSRVREKPVPEGAKSQGGTPQPGTGHSR